MLSSTRLGLLMGGQGRHPVRPRRRMYDRQYSSLFTVPYGRLYWRRMLDPDYATPSYWVSDFKHKHLINTGRDFKGRVPETPQSGMYQKFTDENVTRALSWNFKPSRESRHLPMYPLTPRVVYEFRRERRQDFNARVLNDKRKIAQLRETEFHEWFMKLQRVRGKWCRDNEIRSRGVYGPAVDAAEIWG